MSSRSLFAAVAAVASLAVSSLATAAAAPETFGAGVSLSEVTPLDRVLARPAELEGKTVRVEGVVTAVCTHMGCWMALARPEAPGGPTVMLKVDDGVVVFPVTAKGRRASAQGVVERVGGNAESREAAAEHARQAGQGPKAKPAQWQIKATGAVVY